MYVHTYMRQKKINKMQASLLNYLCFYMCACVRLVTKFTRFNKKSVFFFSVASLNNEDLLARLIRAKLNCEEGTCLAECILLFAYIPMAFL